MKTLRSSCLALLAAALVASAAAAQPKLFPDPSPSATLKQAVGLGEITIEYSRPGVKGRKIFGPGGLRPYGEIWRTGANTSTKIVFSKDVKVEGQPLAAGEYALFTIPGEKEWTIIFNKVVGEWGAYTYKPESDALRVNVKPLTLAGDDKIETLIIDINNIKTDGATLNIGWERTWVPVRLQFDVIPEVVAKVDAAIASGKAPANLYLGAAMFYYDNNLDDKKALSYINEATKGDKVPFYALLWKARILARNGDKAGAEAAAKASIAAAEGTAKDEYIRLNEAVLNSLK